MFRNVCVDFALQLGPGAEGVSWYASLWLIACHCHIMRGATDPPKFLTNILHPKLCYIWTNGRSLDFHKSSTKYELYSSKPGVIIWGPGHRHWKIHLFSLQPWFLKMCFYSSEEKVNMSTQAHSGAELHIWWEFAICSTRFVLISFKSAFH